MPRSWDCHGLPIEWKIEEEYRAKGKSKDDARWSNSGASAAKFAAKWIEEVQKGEFKRLGIIGDWEHPYTTMSLRVRSRHRARAGQVRHERWAL